MTEDEEYEAERLKALAERAAEDPQGSIEHLKERYGPETHGCHEALHVTNLVVELIERALASHGAIIQNPEWFRHVRKAQDELGALYQKIGAAHLDAPPKA